MILAVLEGPGFQGLGGRASEFIYIYIYIYLSIYIYISIYLFVYYLFVCLFTFIYFFQCVEPFHSIESRLQGFRASRFIGLKI